MTKTPKKQFTDATPEGLKTPEGKHRTAIAMREFEDATTEVANVVTRFFKDHNMTLIEVTGGIRIQPEDRIALREDIDRLDGLIADRCSKQEEFLRAIAGAPPAHDLESIAAHIETLTDLQYAKAEVNAKGPWALYIYGDDGFHSGRRWFVREVEYPEEQITIAKAKELADVAVQCGYEVRICDGGDMLVFHWKDGKTLYGEGFWEAIQ